MINIVSSKNVPAFEDEPLCSPGIIHHESCPGGLLESGKSSGRRCRCSGSNTMIQRGTKGEIIRYNPSRLAALVKFRYTAPIWVETATLMTILPQSTPPTEKASESDVLVFEDWAGLNPSPKKWKRRRRPVIGGELVLVRSERNQLKPYRFIMTYQKYQTAENPTYAMLLDPHASKEEALNPNWTQIRNVLVPEGKSPASIFYPIFPLADGTEDPGWIDTEVYTR